MTLFVFPLFIILVVLLQLDMTFKVAIIADSRGGFFQHFLNLHNDNVNVTYTTLVFSGRRLEELWLQARAKLNAKEFNHVYVLGGICNLTSPYFHNGLRSFWPFKNVEDLAYDLIQLLKVITNEALFLGHQGRLTFLPEIGADLLEYNRVEYPMPWMTKCQVDLNYNIFFLLDEFKSANVRLSCSTTWTFDCVYGRNRHGMFYPKYSRLYDGLHPAPNTAADMVRKIIKDVNLLLQC